MAKKKSDPKPPPPDTRAIIVTLKGNPEFRDWLNGLAEHARNTAVAVTEHALVEYARNHGYAKPAPKR